jgi:hypothetical protein
VVEVVALKATRHPTLAVLEAAARISVTRQVRQAPQGKVMRVAQVCNPHHQAVAVVALAVRVATGADLAVHQAPA